MTTIKEVTVPDIGNFADVEIIEVAVKPGDVVKAEDALITLETEKASMDVPSPYAGTIKEVKVKLGQRISQGALIVLIETQATTQEQPKKDVQQTATSSSAPEKLTVTVPDIGSAKEVEIIEVSVKAGDNVKSEDTLITLESEKASMDIPAPQAGNIVEMFVKVGDKVSTGTPILTLLAQPQTQRAAASASATLQRTATAPSRAAPKAAPVTPVAHKPLDFSLVHAGPATRQLARELGVDLAKVAGTGRKNRITTADVKAFVKAIMQGGAGSGLVIEKAPEIDFAQFGDIEVKPLSRIKKWTAKNLFRNWVTIPHVTQFEEADVTDLEILRQAQKQAAEEKGVKLTPLPFIIKACVNALKMYPQFNASLASNGADLIYKKYFHIGFAVDTPSGLMVPIVRHADQKSLFDIAKELVELSTAAREGKLKAEQMQGSCFTLSSLGSIGGTAFTPIINAPDVAILGISKVQIKPVYLQEQFVPRKMLPLSLSYDHRVIDGVEGAKFAAQIATELQEPKKLLEND